MAYRELMANKEEAAAIFLQDFIKDVDCELKFAERKSIELNSVDYSLAYIIGEQKRIHDKYKDRMSW